MDYFLSYAKLVRNMVAVLDVVVFAATEGFFIFKQQFSFSNTNLQLVVKSLLLSEEMKVGGVHKH